MMRVTQIYGRIFGRIIPNLGRIIRPPEIGEGPEVGEVRVT
jgi:hypothetical protein